MKLPKIAVMYLPGNNCEVETLRAVKVNGVESSIVRWNQLEGIDAYHGYVIVGGWAYEDRIRAGAIAAKDPIIKLIQKESESGKPVLGICNGAQVLVEAGMVPNINGGVEMALAPNINPFVSGYYDSWIYAVSEQKKGSCAFNKLFEQQQVMAMPVAHGEGRFTTRDHTVLEKLEKNKQIILKYALPNGEVANEFPWNPNGSELSIAGLSNKKGNVMAMMPHPERSSFVYQMPYFQDKINSIGDVRMMQSPTAANNIFTSMKRYIEEEIL